MDNEPLILNKDGTEKFARKKVRKVDADILTGMRIVIPPIYYWEDVNLTGKSIMMTMAFRMNGRLWGESQEIVNEGEIPRQRNNLFGKMRETLDVLLHHGDKVLDSNGDIDPRLVYDEEALRWKYDERWPQKVAAFNQLVRLAPITRARAIELKLIEPLML